MIWGPTCIWETPLETSGNGRGDTEHHTCYWLAMITLLLCAFIFFLCEMRDGLSGPRPEPLFQGCLAMCVMSQG